MTPTQQLALMEQAAPDADFQQALARSGLSPLRPLALDVLQLNVGKLCNQTCRHCHVDAGPDRTDQMMDEVTARECLDAAERTGVTTLDITGGAPELNPNFRMLVEGARRLGCHVIDRCNLTILESGSQRGLAEFLAEQRVEVVCSLPHYRRLNTDRQRGDGVYEKSIRALQRLNALGYGQPGSGLRLTLVTNPVGAFLPPQQASIEAEWKRALLADHGVVFDQLIAITNMPIARYLEWLALSDNVEAYMGRLVRAYNPAAAAGVMCRSMISVGWDGRLYDCDFNQMLELPCDGQGLGHVRDLAREGAMGREVVTGRHCFGCTAGQGSSCGGATASSNG
ncbi:MAG: arsenosugar biosynthesis radical SAM protein ArsS [Sandaracinaceae bacterium]|nr:arsenosugar biosynthesis radical SAM protein ArsS [Sandaracinaceae bacterium]